MKDIKTEREQLRQIADSLTCHDVLSAVQHMQALAKSVAGDEALNGLLFQLEEDYRKLLLRVSTKNVSSEERAYQIDELKCRGFMLHSRLSRDLLLMHENTLYASTFLQCIPREWKTLWRDTMDIDERSQLQDDIFDAIWTSSQWTKQERLWWQDFMDHQNELVLQHWLGAVIQSLWMFWDVEKMYLLAYFLHSNNKNVQELALLGNIVVLSVYPNYYSATFESPNPYNDLVDFHEDICLFQLEFMRMKACERIEAEETEKLEQKVLNENDEQRVKRLMMLGQGFNRLRLKHGLDLSFSKRHLLHICTFLKRPAHWWTPFDESRSEVAKACYDANGEVRQAYQLLIEGCHECDLQHYLSCFMLAGENIRMEIQGEVPEDFIERIDRTPLPVHKRLVQNLYRINYQSPVHQFLKDIFKSVSFMENRYLRRTFHDEEICQIHSLASDLMLGELMDTKALEELASRNGLSAELSSMIAESYINHQDFAKALAYLEKADLLSETNEALLFKMASCAHQLSKYDYEIDLLKRWHELAPDNMLPMQHLANLYYQLKRFEASKSLLQEFTYRYPQTLGAWLKLIFTDLQLCDYLDAQKNVARMFQCFPTDTLTFFMAGCLAFMKDDWSGAIAHFRRVGEKDFAEHFKLLNDLPISAVDKELIYDCVMRQ